MLRCGALITLLAFWAIAQSRSSAMDDEHAIRAAVAKFIKAENSKAARDAVWSERTPFLLREIRIRFLDSDTAIAMVLGAIWSSANGATPVAMCLLVVRDRGNWRVQEYERRSGLRLPSHCIDDICLDGADAQVRRAAKECAAYAGGAWPELIDRGAQP